MSSLASILMVYHFPRLTLQFAKAEHKALQILNICIQEAEAAKN